MCSSDLEPPTFGVIVVVWYIVVMLFFAHLFVTIIDYSKARGPETNRARLYVPFLLYLIIYSSFW